MRLTVVAFGGLLILLTWLIGRTLFDRSVGLVAAAGTAFTPVIVASSSAVWPDVPGAAIGLAVLAVLILSVRSDRVSWWVLLAAPLAVLATIIRFGAPIPIGIGALAIAIWRWPVVRRSIPQLVVLALLTSSGVMAVLAVPAVLGATQSPLDAVATMSASNDFPFYRGFVDYAKMYDFLLLTPTGLVLSLGLMWAAVVALRLRDDRNQVLLAASIGLATAVVLAVTLHGEYRYLAPVYPWLWLAAAVGLVHGARQMRRDFLIGPVAMVVVAALLAGVADGGTEMANSKNRFLELRTASRQIDADTEDQDCAVVTSYGPQVAWYSNCITAKYSFAGVRLTVETFPVDAPVYVLAVQNGKRQPDGELLDDYLAAGAGNCFEVGEPDDGPLRFVEACLVGGG